MRVEGLQFEIPELAYNPFSTSPLESNQSDLYVVPEALIYEIFSVILSSTPGSNE